MSLKSNFIICKLINESKFFFCNWFWKSYFSSFKMILPKVVCEIFKKNIFLQKNCYCVLSATDLFFIK